MPELPEVETVMRGMEPSLTGATITKAQINRPDLRWPFPPNMAKRLTGATITALSRRSKYILASLSTEETLLIHLGMSGRILISGDPLGQFLHTHAAPEKHDHVVLDLNNGTRLTFNDPRRFGAMDLIPTQTLHEHKLLKSIGPEPLGNHFTADTLITAFKNRRTPVKSALLDQRIIAGLGNIYVCEALWRAHISPLRHAGRISPKRLNDLVPAIKSTLTEAITAGGSSLKDYRRADGELGYFQHSFAAYGREGEPCKTPSCTGTIKRVTQSGRSTFYCPSCQS